MEKAIKIENVTKIFSKNYKSARNQLMSIFKDSFLGCKKKSTLKKDEFKVLDNVSFNIYKNDKLAILGPNGSGKSTLLKMLSGIYLPDNGRITVKGSIGSVLELSSGFKPELSGYENIYLKFALLGRTKEEVDKIIDEVIEFSELEDFMNTPLKHYSSGMKSKLGFAIVTSFQPDILILDEIFAAGDKKFRAKSKAKIKELYLNCTTILVTHNMSIVKEVANRVVVLKKGRLEFNGGVDEGIEYYNKIMS